MSEVEQQDVVGKADIEKRKTKENLKYQFSNEELLELGKSLAEAQEQLNQHEDDKKQAMDEWKARISGTESNISSLSNRVARGYEWRDIECEITLNEPVGKKTCRRTDTGETVWVQNLSNEEKQRTLKLEEAPEAEAPAEATTSEEEPASEQASEEHPEEEEPAEE